MARSHLALVQGARGHVARGGDDGVLEDSAGLGDVRRQLLRHQEQEGHRPVAGRGRARPQHLREGGQDDAAHRLSVERDSQHIVQRQEVRHQARGQEGARLCLLRLAPPHQQAHTRALHGQPRALHASPQGRQHRGAADEGPGQGGEAAQGEGASDAHQGATGARARRTREERTARQTQQARGGGQQGARGFAPHFFFFSFADLFGEIKCLFDCCVALEEQQRVTKEIEEKRQRAEEERKKLEKERLEAEKRASQIANMAKDEKDRMVSNARIVLSDHAVAPSNHWRVAHPSITTTTNTTNTTTTTNTSKINKNITATKKF